MITFFFKNLFNDFQGLHLVRRDQTLAVRGLGEENLYQSYFVCVLDQGSNLTINYGKSDGNSVSIFYFNFGFPFIMVPDCQCSICTILISGQTVLQKTRKICHDHAVVVYTFWGASLT